MEGFLEEVVFDLSLMDEPDVLRCKKRKGTLQAEDTEGESAEGEASPEGSVIFCQGMGCPRHTANRG